MNVIDSSRLEREAGGQSVSAFPRPAPARAPRGEIWDVAPTRARPARNPIPAILAALAALVVVATALPAPAAAPAHVSARIQALAVESQAIAERDRKLARTLNDPALGALNARRNHERTEALVNAIVIAAIIESPALAPDVVAAAVALLPGMRESIAQAVSAAFPGFAPAIARAAGTAAEAQTAPAIPRAVSQVPAPVPFFAPKPAPPPADADAAGETEAEPGIYDPLETVNRGVLVFNDAVDAVIIKPVAKFYGFVTPEFAKRGVRNFARNLNAPVVLANDLLQLEVGDAAVTVGRFMVNTVFGVAGFADVAEGWNLPHHPADFGQTLYSYGSGPGAYLVVPIIGPSTVRDGFGTGVDTFFHPFTYLFDTYTNLAIAGGKALVRRETLIEPLDDLRASSIDYYAALRSAYFQDRAVELNKGAPPVSGDVDRMFEEFE